MINSRTRWDDAFAQVNENVRRSKALNLTANKLFPLESGELRVNFKGLTNDQRDQIYINTTF